MTTINLEIPDAVLQVHQKNLAHITEEAQQGFIIWQYLNGYLTLKQSADILKLSYHTFTNLLLIHNIVIDKLNNEEFNQQQLDLSIITNKSKDVAGSLNRYAKTYIPTEQAIEQAWQEVVNEKHNRA